MKICQLTAKDSEIKPHEFRISNISKDFTVDSMKKAGFYIYAYDFSVDYDNSNISDITNIHKYLMKKYNIV